MKMKMKMKVVAVAVVVSALLVTDVRSTRPTRWTPTGQPGLDLTGKMFTLSQNGGGVRFYPGSYTPPWATTTRPWATTTRPWAPTTRPWATTTRPWATTTYPQTTETPVRGISVCVRYMADSSVYLTLFTLGQRSRNLKLTTNEDSSYSISNYYFQMRMTPKFRLWPYYQQNMWMSVCLTLDGSNNVAQLFKDSSMSVRLVMPSGFKWPSEPLIEFPGFNGQMTDLQVWDYPLSYKEIYNYMRRGAFRPSRGSLLTWSNISFYNGGKALLEDEYQVLAQQPMRGGGGGGGEKRGGRGGRLRKRKFSAEESQQTKGGLMI